jgi:uncharacterized protein (TIGR02099 family)
MPSLLRKLIKRLGVAAAGLVILAAIGIGAFRIVVAELPSYQGQVRDWARDVLGLSVSFSRLDARWGLRGPEISFYDASVARPDEETEPMISAAEVTLGLSPMALILERRLAVDRLVLDGTQLTLERGVDGELRLQGAPAAGEANADLRIEDLPSVEVIVSDSTINYVDRARDLAWTFSGVRIRLERSEERVLLQARGTPPEALGGQIDISVERALEIGNDGAEARWLVVAELGDLDLATLAAAFPDTSGVPTEGSGDLSLWLETTGSLVRQATAQVEIQNLRLDGDDAAMPTYDDLAVTAEWVREDTGWQLTLTDLALSRDSRRWPELVNLALKVTAANGELSAIDLQSNFLRLEDLGPLIAALPNDAAVAMWQSYRPSGDVADLSLRLARTGDGLDYAVAADFERVGVAAHADLPGIIGVSGTLRADSRSGRLVLATRDAELDWPSMVRERLEIGELSGIMVWRQGRNGTRFVSDNLILNNRDVRTRSSLEVILPADGGPPRLDLDSRLFGFDTTRTPDYLPVGKLPAPVVRWLDRAIIRGRVPEAEVAFFGPINAFPFDDGQGQFRARFSVEGGSLAYVDGWPVAQDISGEVEFLNSALSARGTGRLMSGDHAELSGGVADMREGVLTVTGEVSASLGELLDFLRTVPVTARRLGPDLSRLQSSVGEGLVTLDLTLPLKDIAAYELDATVDMQAGALQVEGFDLAAADIEGRLRLNNNVVTGQDIRATLFGSPVTARVAPAEEPGYRARLDVNGEATAAALKDAFDLPLGRYISGQTQWQGYLLLPANTIDSANAARAPLRLAIESDLMGASLDLPAPLGKPADERMPFELGLTTSPMNQFDIEGRLGTSRRFALSFWSTDSGPQFRRGSVRLDGAYPLLPPDDGLDIEGAVRELSLDEWLTLLRAQNLVSRDEPILSRVDLDVTDMTVFGQRLGPTTFAVRQGRDEWLLELDSDAIAGHIAVPFALRNRPQVVADMQRLHLNLADDAVDAPPIDPRSLPGLLVNAEDFAVGQRSFGRLSANVQADPLGLRLVSYESVSEHYAVEGSGSWLAGVEGSTTRFAFSLLSEDVGATLSDLGLQPIVEADNLEVTASVSWPGGPSASWQQGISGDLSLHLDQGSMINLEPGAGRMWGLLSFTALPRRLALDFRDVFNRGLVFDEVAGDFVLVDGNAYTDNLLLTGPVADIGVVGRTGLRNEDYQQQAVVTAEPGKVLPTMGFLAGPGVGAALLLFTQIFKEPLKGIGRASYCVSGGWDAPVVERLTPEQLQAGYLCADLPPSAATVADSLP